MTKPPSSDFDAIVIGAGHNGLVTAAYLAREGLSTLLIEARSEVGGTAASDHFAGARVNICNCDHLTFRTTPVAEELNLSRYGLSYINVEPPQVNLDWSSQTPWELWHDVEQTVESIAHSHPDSVDGYRRFARAAIPVAKLILDASSQPPTRGSLLSSVIRKGGRGVTTMLRMSRMSAADVMREFFTNEAIIGPAMVEGPVVWGLSPETPGTGLGAVAFALRHVAHVGRPVGGSGALPEALKQSFLQSGGLLRTGTKVVGIVCEGNSVRAVQTSDGATVTARIVVSACDPHRTFVKWLKNPPARAQSLVERWTATPSGEGYESKIDAVTTEPSSLLGRAPVASTIIVSPSLAELHRGAQLMQEGRTMPRMALLANSPSVTDSTLAPSGQHVFSLESLYTPYSFTDGWTSKDEPERWLRQFATLAQPNFMDTITDWRVMTPADYETEFHLPKGHATSFAGGPLAAFMGTNPELTRYHTPIKGLYLTGAATFPGAGVWGASGRNTALTVLKEMR
ncbi:MAG: NAD(P)/FAD-dependent oxidoreductase [Ilumatobacteraceae bacterium]|jgi:beta-carotene ketolase (CrtO type)|nr:NAD(P)/FAD-dependent oxidoreductase [Ilumatobacteraceae bacterium]